MLATAVSLATNPWNGSFPGDGLAEVVTDEILVIPAKSPTVYPTDVIRLLYARRFTELFLSRGFAAGKHGYDKAVLRQLRAQDVGGANLRMPQIRIFAPPLPQSPKCPGENPLSILLGFFGCGQQRSSREELLVV